MVKQFFKFLNKETSSLHQAAYLLGLFAVLSQVLAFLRDRLLASQFGAGKELDVYYAAFRIPDFLFVTVASVVSLSVLVPFIVEREKFGTEKVREFIEDIFSFFFYLIFGVSAIAYFFIPYISSFIFKGLPPDELTHVVFLSRLLLISPIALGFSNLFGSLTQAYNRFFIYAIAPLLYNAGIIIGIIYLAPSLGITGVAWGVGIGALMHLMVQLPFVAALDLFPRLKAKFNFASIRKVVTLSFPRTLTLSINHIATIFLVSLAALMTIGSISVYSLSLNIQSISLSIIGVSYSLAAFPTLSRHYANKNIADFVKQMATTARHIIFWSLPVASLFIVLRAQIVRVLLGSGNFSWDNTRLTAAALALFSLSAVFQSLMLLFVRAFYSAGHTKKPLLINLLCTSILILCTYILTKIFYWSPEFRYFIESLMKVEGIKGTEVLMLPLGYSVGTTINGIIHWVGFEKDFPGFSKEVRVTFFQSSAAAIIMGAISYLGLFTYVQFFKINTLLGIFLQGLFAGVCAIIAGIVILLALQNREIGEAWSTIHKKFWRAKVVATDPEII